MLFFDKCWQISVWPLLYIPLLQLTSSEQCQSCWSNPNPIPYPLLNDYTSIIQKSVSNCRRYLSIANRLHFVTTIIYRTVIVSCILYKINEHPWNHAGYCLLCNTADVSISVWDPSPTMHVVVTDHFLFEDNISLSNASWLYSTTMATSYSYNHESSTTDPGTTLDHRYN